MNIRWIIHKADGSTVTSEWNNDEVSFRKNWSNTITSLQLQTEDKKFYTLSSKGKNSLFWQEDDYVVVMGEKAAAMVARKIFKNIGKNLWLVLLLDTNVGKPSLNVIERRIGING